MKNFNVFVSLVFLLVSVQLTAQESITKKGEVEELYEEYGYGAALEKYGSTNTTSSTKEHNIKMLADSYRLTGDSENAEYWYQQLMETNAGSSLDQLYYAQALLNNGKYTKAKEWFLTYSQSEGNEDNVGKQLAEACDKATMMLADKDVIVKNMVDLNSEKLDFSPMFYRNGLVFTSTRTTDEKLTKRKDLWTNDNFMDLYRADVDADNLTSGVSHLFREVNIKYHDGAATFTKDQNTMYFSRSNYKNGKRRKDEKGITRLKIYESKNNSRDWGDAVELPFNDDDFDTCHPTLDASGNVLYFTSDRPGGFGGMDIYRSRKMGNTWSTPENMGPEINTEGNEIFPFIHQDGTLYFASKGLPGIGGLDVFSTTKISSNNENVNWTTPVNLGKPINTNKDDFSLIVDISGTRGYFTSNREGGKGMDDIYSFVTKKGIQNMGKSVAETMMATAQLCVMEEATATRLEDVKVSVMEMVDNQEYDVTSSVLGDEEFMVELKPLDARKEKFSLNLVRKKDNLIVQNADNELFTDVQGNLSHAFFTNKKYKFVLEKEGYETKEYYFSYNEYLKNETVCIEMKRDKCTRFKGTVFNKKYKNTLPNTSIKVLNKCTGEITKLSADENGEFDICMDCNCDYEILATKPYFSADLQKTRDLRCNQLNEIPFYLANKSTGLSLADNQQPQVPTTPAPIAYGPPVVYNYPPPPPGGYPPYPGSPYNVGQIIELKNIFYDFDKSYIREDATGDLNKVVNLLQRYPGMKIELGSHTDARGSDAYNKALAERRAKAAVEYIVNQGIPRSRIVAMGYGEQILKNPCGNGVDCPEEAHQRNRRTEIKVLEIDPNQINVKYIDNLPEIIDTPKGRRR